MNLVVPLSFTVSLGVAHVPPDGIVFCCNRQPVEGEGHETTAVLVVVRKIFNVGAFGDWMAYSAQNPPVSEKLPPVNGPPASCWPIVPLTVKTPPVLVPPPPATLNQSIE